MPRRRARARSRPRRRQPQPPRQPATSPVLQGAARASRSSSGGTPKKYVGHPISMDFQGVDLRSVLRTFTEISGLNMVIDPVVPATRRHRADATCRGIRRSRCCCAAQAGLHRRRHDRAHRADVGAAPKKKDGAASWRSEGAGRRAARADLLAELREGRRPVAAARQVGAVAARPDSGRRAHEHDHHHRPAGSSADRAALLGALDRPEPQVEVEARVVQTTREFARAIGVQWGLNGRVDPASATRPGWRSRTTASLGGRTGAATRRTTPARPATTRPRRRSNLPVAGATSAIGLALGAVNGAFNLDVALSALERTRQGTHALDAAPDDAEQRRGRGDAGHPDSDSDRRQQHRHRQLQGCGADAAGTPQITSANTVIMQITLENATPDFSRQVNGIPPIDTQRADHAGAGRRRRDDDHRRDLRQPGADSNERTPVLHRVPLLGWLFKRDTMSDESRELLIFITPRIKRVESMKAVWSAGIATGAPARCRVGLVRHACAAGHRDVVSDRRGARTVRAGRRSDAVRRRAALRRGDGRRRAVRRSSTTAAASRSGSG